MEQGPDKQRLQQWFESIASTEEEEVDCAALEEALETIVVIASSGEDIRNVLPAIAVHLDHCPECGEIYETLVVLARENP